MTDTPPLAGQVVVFAGTLARSSRREATALVERQLGRVAAAVTRETTMLVLGRDVEAPDRGHEGVERRVAEAQRLNERFPGRVRVLSEDEFFALAGVDVTADPAAALYGSRAIRSRYPSLRDDHLRYLERWGLIRAVRKARNESFYGFADLAVIRQASAELARGLSFRAVLRALVAERTGQLAFDFQPPKGDTQPAKVVTLTPRVRRGTGAGMGSAAGGTAAGGLGAGFGVGAGFPSGAGGGVGMSAGAGGAGAAAGAGLASGAGATGPEGMRFDAAGRASRADEAFEMAARYFADGSSLDTGDEDQQHAATLAYRRALALDPYMVAALVNLANLHYAHDAIAEAEALYEKALSLESTCFEARFNLGNVFHDTGRFEDAARCYVQALALDPGYADAHFYLAVTLEKLGRSPEARPHWVAYQRLAPEGEWVELAREFSD